MSEKRPLLDAFQCGFCTPDTPFFLFHPEIPSELHLSASRLPERHGQSPVCVKVSS